MIPTTIAEPTPKETAAAIVRGATTALETFPYPPPVPPGQPFRAALRAELDWAVEVHPPTPSPEHGAFLVERATEELVALIDEGDRMAARKAALRLATLVVRLGEDHLSKPE